MGEREIEVVDDATARVLAAKTGAERLAIAFGMFSSARRMLTPRRRARHPEWSERQVEDEAARRLSHGSVSFCGDEIDFDYVDGWAPRLGVADLWRRVRESAGR